MCDATGTDACDGAEKYHTYNNHKKPAIIKWLYLIGNIVANILHQETWLSRDSP